jgi:hypothetical protein
MKFILQENQETKLPSLKDVEVNQFFVNLNGCLCQKVCDISYLRITDENQKPWCCSVTEQSINLRIKKILPKVVKIEF